MNTLLASILDCISPVAKIGVASRRRRDSQWRRQSSSPIPNPRPIKRSSPFFSRMPVCVIVIPILDSLFSIENRLYARRLLLDVHFAASGTKRFRDIPAALLGSYLQCLCVIVSMVVPSFRAWNNRSDRLQSVRDLAKFNLYYLTSAKFLSSALVADRESLAGGSRIAKNVTSNIICQLSRLPFSLPPSLPPPPVNW